MSGMHLARIEMNIALEEPLRRIPDFDLVAEIRRRITPVRCGAVHACRSGSPRSPGPAVIAH